MAWIYFLVLFFSVFLFLFTPNPAIEQKATCQILLVSKRRSFFLTCYFKLIQVKRFKTSPRNGLKKCIWYHKFPLLCVYNLLPLLLHMFCKQCFSNCFNIDFFFSKIFLFKCVCVACFQCLCGFYFLLV